MLSCTIIVFSKYHIYIPIPVLFIEYKFIAYLHLAAIVATMLTPLFLYDVGWISGRHLSPLLRVDGSSFAGDPANERWCFVSIMRLKKVFH